MTELPKSDIRQKAENDLVLSFLSVRRAIGILGFFLPLALIAYGILSRDGILTSISAYYYSPMREVLVGTLCAQAVFLWSYEGYRREPTEWLSDKMVARAAALGALGVALFPTIGKNLAEPDATATEPAPVPASCPDTLSQCVLGDAPASLIHYASAGLFFGALAVFCLVLFTRGDSDTPQKRARKRIYRICGWIVVVSLVLMAALTLTGLAARLAALRPVFWLEVLASFAFATGWSVKGMAMQPLVRMAVAADEQPAPEDRP